MIHRITIKVQKKTTKYIGILSLNNKITACILVLLLLSLTACSSRTVSADTIVEYAVPFADTKSRFATVTLLEEDDFGRQLYSYRSDLSHTSALSDYVIDTPNNSIVLSYVVSQHEDSDFIYCYEDVCYHYTSSLENPNTSLIESLKEENDWNKPLKKEKTVAYTTDISSKSYEYSYPWNTQDAVSALCKVLGREITDYYIDPIFTTQIEPIYVMREVLKNIDTDEEEDFGQSYIFTLDENNDVAKYAELSSNIDNWREEINAFKATLD